MDVETYIQEKVKLFKNEKYFQLFKTILINLSKNFSVYNKQYSLSGRMDSSKNKKNISLWFYIMKIVLDKLKTKEKKFFIKNNLNVNPLVFSYLVKLCKNKLGKLEKIAIAEKASMDNILRLYLDLCQEETNIGIKEISKNQKLFYDEINSYKNKTNSKNKLKQNILSKLDLIETDVKNKYGIGKFRLIYNRSLSRLFIGDTDVKSIQKKHLMNVKVKKDRLKSNGLLINKSEIFSRRIINEFEEEKGNYIDDDLNRIINKFKLEQKYLDDYKKNLKLEQSQSAKKLKTNNSKLKFKNKNFNIFNIVSPRNIYKSSSQINITSLLPLKAKSSIYNSNTNKFIKTAIINFGNNIKRNNNSYISNTPKNKTKIFFSGLNEKRKISKATFDKFKKYKINNNHNIYKIDFKNYLMKKKDFFFNNEFNK